MSVLVLSSPPTSDLTIAVTALRELGLPDQEDLDRLSTRIAQASDACGRFCNRPEGFGRYTIRQTERDFGLSKLRLEYDLEPTIASVTVDGVVLTSDEYVLDRGRLFRLSGTSTTYWSGELTVVEYSAGYALLYDEDDEAPSLPHAIERACLSVLASIYGKDGRDPMLRSESAQGIGSVSYLAPPMGAESVTQEAKGLLAPFIRWRA